MIPQRLKDWLDGLAWKLIEKLCTKFKPGDMIASAEADETISKARLLLSKLVMVMGAELRKS